MTIVASNNVLSKSLQITRSTKKQHNFVTHCFFCDSVEVNNSAVDRDVEVNAGHSGAVEDDDDVNRRTDNECDVVADTGPDPHNDENSEVNNSRQTERVSESVDDIITEPQVGGASDGNVQGQVRILRCNDGVEVSPDTVVYPLARKVCG